MVGDKISDLIITIKNASRTSKDEVFLDNTKLNLAILDVLQKKGFIDSFELEKKGYKVKVMLKYDEQGNSVINDVKRVSKLSKRIYKNAKNINPIKNGYGLAVISTPYGILSDTDAREKNVGGEVMFEIW